MHEMNNALQIFGGINSEIFDIREFNIEKGDLLKACQRFNLGSLISYKKEKNIKISHTNFIVFIETNKGEYVLKFTPLNTYENITKELLINITKELLINKLVTKHKFPTPVMLTTSRNQPCIKRKNYLISCYLTINGAPLYLKRIDSMKIKKINGAIKRLNYLLNYYFKKKELSNLPDKENFNEKINSLVFTSKKLGHYSNKKLINFAIKRCCNNYLFNHKKFVKKPIHSNITLSNMLFRNGKIFILDLSHIRIDYELNDLANLIVSFYSLDIPQDKIKKLISCYFIVNNIQTKKLGVLNNFVTLHLIKEYLKTIEKEKNVTSSVYQSEFSKIFMLEINNYKKKILRLIKDFMREN